MDLFIVSRADIFAIYPKILKELLQAEESESTNEDGELSRNLIYLPSDVEIQERIYYRLLKLQKEINRLLESGIPYEEIVSKKTKHIWDPSVHSETLSVATLTPSPLSTSSIKKRYCIHDNPVNYLDSKHFNVWKLEDLAKAGKLLRRPSIECEFYDEHEMRRIYSMIYDVFRYKHVLGQAFHDVSFFAHYPQLRTDKNRLWLLLYDLHLRHFLKRVPNERVKQKYLYKEADLDVLQSCIWKHKVHLAASISRLRIKNSALQLSHLLPIHLQDEKVAIAAANPIVTGWINPFKIKTKAEANEYLTSFGLIELEETENGEKPLVLSHFKWDKICSLFLSCIPHDRSHFAKSKLIKENQFIMQDRAFSLGPAAFSCLMEYFEIDGDVAQTHVSSPRSTAYLAALFYCNNRVNDFIAFGAGNRLQEYREFLEKLGCDNVRIYAENYCDIPLDSPILDKCVGVFVTPPNSYSGVTDPIDLICSRGGDLAMLEILTESEMSDESKKRVAKILDDQRQSLRLAMSRPQVQYCLYETHSVVDSENEIMAKRAIDNINKCAYVKHLKIFKEKKRLEALAEQEGINAENLDKLQGAAAMKKKLKTAEETATLKRLAYESDSTSSDISDTELVETPRSRASKRSTASDEHYYIKVPKTDIFETVDLPDFCQYHDNCVNFKDHGLFLSLIKRKMITRLDEKYLISMAEKRGLFGDVNPKRAKSRTVTRSSKKDENRKSSKKAKRKKNEDISVLLDRISQPTHSFINHSQMLKMSSFDNKMLLFNPSRCNRHGTTVITDSTESSNDYLTANRTPNAKRWWQVTSKYIRSLKLLTLPKTDDKIKEISKNIKEKKTLPLNLPRALPTFECISPKIIKRSSYENHLYPMATNYIQFNEYREPQPNFLNIPPLVYTTNVEEKNSIDRKKVQRPSSTTFKPLGFE